MATAFHWHFAPFRLDPDNACLWHGDKAIALRPKTFAVLQYLITHAGELVTKDALLAACWTETAVSEAGLKVCIAELRKVLGEAADASRFIATVHRRGYRFVAPVSRCAAPAPAAATSHPRLKSRRGGLTGPLLHRAPPPECSRTVHRPPPGIPS
jgi:DNA-binding winged helix-turn-helix (wHTH) protein